MDWVRLDLANWTHVQLCNQPNDKGLKYEHRGPPLVSVMHLVEESLTKLSDSACCGKYYSGVVRRRGSTEIDPRVTWVCVHDLTCHQNDLKVD